MGFNVDENIKEMSKVSQERCIAVARMFEPKRFMLQLRKGLPLGQRVLQPQRSRKMR